MSNVPNFKPLPSHQEQYVVVKFRYLLKQTPTQMYAAMKEAYGEQTLARSTIFHWHQQFTQGRTSASPKPMSGRLIVASTEKTLNTIGMMHVYDDSLTTDSTHWYFANHCEKDYSLSFLSCNFCRGVCLRFYTTRSYGRSSCVIGLIF